jgi:aldehyde dehydrogenase (NAD+)
MSISHLFQEQQKHRTAIRNTTVSERSALLKKLEKELLNRRTDLQQALFTDFRKPAMEADITELWVVLAEIRHIRKNLRNWMRPVKADIPLAMLGTSAETVYFIALELSRESHLRTTCFVSGSRKYRHH